MRLALYTFGQFIQPSEHPGNDTFHDLNDQILAEIEAAEGFIARSGYDSDPGPESWGVETYPRFYEDNGDGWAPATLSLWRDIESVAAATYSGLHGKAYARGRDWFRLGDWPPLVLWWIGDDEQPEWTNGVARLEELYDSGPAPRAFTFKAPFDQNGNSTSLDHDRVKSIRARSAAKMTKGRN